MERIFYKNFIHVGEDVAAMVKEVLAFKVKKQAFFTVNLLQ